MLVLQAGDNASTDYYLRPRLAVSGLEWAIADLRDTPESLPIWDRNGLLVILCRYADPKWLKAIEARRPLLWGVVHFVDDDLEAMAADAGLSMASRGRVAHRYLRHLAALEVLLDDQWVSTEGLANRLGEPRRPVLGPTPCDIAPQPIGEPPPLVVYHGTDSHAAERAFVAKVARECLSVRPDIRFEITGTPHLLRDSAAPANVEIVEQCAWPDYKRRQTGRSAALFLGPLLDRPLNAVRAPVKVFDAARLGAAGIYADVAPYRDFVRDGVDGVLVSMTIHAWVEAIVGLMADPARRVALATQAWQRVEDLRRSPSPLPFDQQAAG